MGRILPAAVLVSLLALAGSGPPPALGADAKSRPRARSGEAGDAVAHRAAAVTAGHALLERRTARAERRAITRFEEALEADTRSASARAGLAEAYAMLFLHHERRPEHLKRARAEAARSVELEPELSEAWASRGWVRNIEGRLPEALSDLERALELDPGNTLARQWLGETLAKAGHLAAGLVHVARAAREAPDSAERQAVAGRLHQVAGRHREAVAYTSGALELDPTLPAFFRLSLAYAHWAVDERERAVEAALRDPALPPAARARLLQLGESGGLRAVVARLLAAEQERSGKGCTEVASIGATILAFLERKGEALACLERSFREGSPPAYYRFDPILDPIRSDPRFAQIVARHGDGVSRPRDERAPPP